MTILYDCCTKIVHVTSFLLICLRPNKVPFKIKYGGKNIKRSDKAHGGY